MPLLRGGLTACPAASSRIGCRIDLGVKLYCHVVLVIHGGIIFLFVVGERVAIKNKVIYSIKSLAHQAPRAVIDTFVRLTRE